MYDDMDDWVHAMTKRLAARFDLELDKVLLDFNSHDWSWKRESFRDLGKEFSREFDRLEQGRDQLQTVREAEDRRARQQGQRLARGAEIQVGEPQGLPDRDGCGGHPRGPGRDGIGLGAVGHPQMSRESILWGFLGAGFAAPIDHEVALAVAAAWCFVVALAGWRAR